MINPESLIEKFNSRKPSLEAWAKIILSELEADFVTNVKNYSKELFFKLPPSYRIKQDASFIKKALNTVKNYSDPISQITDQIGIRLVVLTTDEVQRVTEVISNNKNWKASKDRDYETEMDNQPYTFGYKSMHFILRPKDTLKFDNYTIGPDICCEVQVRTLLQHAYAELSHFVVYKPKLKAKNEIGYNRLLARSMALIETVDENFKNVMRSFDQDFSLESAWIAKSIELSKPLRLKPFSKDLNEGIVDSFSDVLASLDLTQFELFISENNFIFQKINDRIEADKPFYDQPIILLLYFLASEIGYDEFFNLFPFSIVYIGDVFADLGISSHYQA